MNKNNLKTSKPSVGQNDVTTKQFELLTSLFASSDRTADNHIDRPKGMSGDVFNALKKKELVNAHGKFVWVTKKGAELIKTEVHGSTSPVAAAAPKAKRVKKEASETLNWAFRRLRRQALLFFGSGLKRDGLTENLKKLRTDLEEVPESYKALRDTVDQLVENDNKLSGTWDTFMEFFFAHEIHPGARSK